MDEKTEFSEFITDQDGDYSHAQFLSLASALLKEGRRPHRVFLAMHHAAATAALEHSVYEYYQFMKAISDELADYMPRLEAELDRMISDQKQ